ncbi:alkylated DNA repair protein ALKBH8 homolog isoform X2 [Prosopis cineraria]|uniref:alkylated DNA repair protein ALKBH8 homolog isoform X2 n=1 Tax=Prosopis cineraria TaxID=364024 RepID=UPI00240F7122|nr:alkylated DNA repair protein ALKBH8 homolog isoform X2 [Prosopis cineraria]
MDDHKVMLEQVFGLSSDSEVEDSMHEDDRSRHLLAQNPIFQSVPQINGLWFCRDFLSSDQQSILLSAIRKEGWFNEALRNQAMRFGDLPTWSTELSDSIRELVFFNDDGFQGDGQTSALPWDLLWREPLFNQLIVNVYEPGEGICAHVDLLRFEDGIAIVSLESPCVMHFTRVESTADGVENEEKSSSSTTRVPILLTPGSLVLMSGEARYNWKHEINRKPGFQIWEGRELDQMRRTSITLRKLCPSE